MPDDTTEPERRCDGSKRCGFHHAVVGVFRCCCGLPWVNKSCASGAKAGEPVLPDRQQLAATGTTAPVTAEDLRERVAAALHGTYPADWHGAPANECTTCQTHTTAVLAALAGGSGDLPAQTAEAIGAAIEERDASERPGDEYGPMTAHFAAAAMSVRWEHAIALEAELARLHQGEADDPGEPGTWPTPAQWIRRWNDMTPERRLEIAGGAVEGMQAAAVCRYQPGHEGQIAQLRAERDALRATVKSVEALRDIWNLLPGFREEADALDAALDAPHAPADAPTPVPAGAEVHGETTEAQEARE